MNAIVDTNAFLDGFDPADGAYEKTWVVPTVLEELDHLKKNRDRDLATKAKYAIKKIKKAQEVDKINFRLKFSCACPLDMSEPDNKILAYAQDICAFDKEAVLITADYNVAVKADVLKNEGINIPCLFIEGTRRSPYTGFFRVSGTTEEINAFFQDIEDGKNSYKLFENQYIIVEHAVNKTSEYRYSNEKLVRLKLPDIDGLRPLNSEQRCAFDLILNKNIPIKVIAGVPGGGKSLIATRLGMYALSKGDYSKMLILRNPVGAGVDPGALPGGLDEKCGGFWDSIKQHMDSMAGIFGKTTKKGSRLNDQIEDQIETNIPYFIKGASYGSTFVLFDEAEDADIDLVRLIGSRIESDSCVVFTGDYRQAETRYKDNNGLYTFIQRKKGDPLVGIVVLSEDVRSPASKVFADFY